METCTSTEQALAKPGPGLLTRIVTAILVRVFDSLPAGISAKMLRPLFEQAARAFQAGPFEKQQQQAQEHPVVRIPVAGFPDAALTFFTPKERGPDLLPLVLWIHGGGWISGSAAMLTLHSRVLAAHGFVVASLDYSLAPDHCYPTPVHQAMAAMAYLKDHAHEFGGDVGRLVIGGESAGAQLTSQVGVLLTNPAYATRVGVAPPLPGHCLRGLLLYCGIYNVGSFVKTPAPLTKTLLKAYSGYRDYRSFPQLDELSTAKHVTADFPPSYIVAGDDDPIEAESYMLDAILRAKGVSVRSRYWTGSGAGIPHAFMYSLETQASQTVLHDTVQFIRECTENKAGS